MKRIGFIKQGLFFLGLFQAMSFSYAGAPLWTFTPLTATTISVPADSTATVQYQVTNQSSRAHTLAMSSITGVSQLTTGAGVCGNPFTLSGHGSCTLSLQIDGSQVASGSTNGPIVCEQGSTLQCYRPSPVDILNVTVTAATNTTTLSTSLSNLALETSGHSRTITITNTGSNPAESLSINYPSWPSGTSANSNCGSSLGATNTCRITVNPGTNATSSCNSPYSAPTPGVITVSASNVTSSVTTNVYVLTYGCIYQEGYIFGIDDTTPTTTSIGGTTAALTDNSSGIQWNNGSSFFTTNAQSLTNGATNTAKIISVQGAGSYAAETCANYTVDSSGNSPCSTGTCYSNWYLPAICQMGASGEGAACTPGTANMVSNLPNLISGCSGSSCLSGEFWSSTEYYGYPQYAAWYEFFSSGGSNQFSTGENISYAVRCSRALTP